MKKNLFYAVLGAALVFSACKKSSKTETDPFKLTYSNLTIEEQKKDLEKSGLQFVDKIEDLKNQKFINVLNHFMQLNFSASDQFSGVYSVSAAAEKKDVKALLRAVTSAESDVRSLQELYGVYTWNKAKEDWDEAAASDRLEFKFPASEESSSNNASLVFKYTKSNIVVDSDEEKIELPASASLVLNVDSKEEFKFSSEFSYKTDGTPVKISSSLALGIYSIKTEANNNTSDAAVSFSLNKGSEKLMAFSAGAKGNFTLNEEMNEEDIVSNANATFQIMNIKLAGVVDIKNIIDAKNKLGNLEDEALSKAEAEIWNSQSKFVAVNTSSNTLIAKTEFASVKDSDEYCYWNGSSYTCNTYTYYSVEPRLVFKDGSKQSLDEFFAKGFDGLIERLGEVLFE